MTEKKTLPGKFQLKTGETYVKYTSAVGQCIVVETPEKDYQFKTHEEADAFIIKLPQMFLASEAKEAADYRNSDEFQFNGIIESIKMYAKGQHGHPNVKGLYEISFRRLRPDFKILLEGMGYVVEDSTKTVPKVENGEQIEEQVESSIVSWGEKKEVTKMEVVKND